MVFLVRALYILVGCISAPWLLHISGQDFALAQIQPSDSGGVQEPLHTQHYDIETFNSAWERNGGVEKIIEKSSIIWTGRENLNLLEYPLFSLGTENDYKQVHNAFQAGFFGGTKKASEQQRLIENNPLLPHALIGFKERCVGKNHKSEDAYLSGLQFSYEFLSKRTFLITRQTNFLKADMDFIRRFEEEHFGFNKLPNKWKAIESMCEVLSSAMTKTKEVLVGETKQSILETNRVHHECGTPEENLPRIDEVISDGTFNRVEMGTSWAPYNGQPLSREEKISRHLKTFYELAKDKPKWGGLSRVHFTDPGSRVPNPDLNVNYKSPDSSTNHCIKYYDNQIIKREQELRLSRIKLEEERMLDKSQKIKKVIDSQSITP
jgi:hypothetical protein